jgi:hypothetical protein
MTPDAITCLFKDAHDAFSSLEGKPSDNDLLAIWETLLPLLMVIPYNQLNRVHSLTTILTKAVKYKANHGAKYDKPIADVDPRFLGMDRPTPNLAHVLANTT